MSGLRQDLAFAVRTLVRSPGFAIVAVVSLALGIAANTTVFSAVDAFVLRPLPFPDAERLVHVWGTNPAEGWEEMSLPLVDVAAFSEAPSLETAVAFTSQGYNLSGTERPERVIGTRAEPGFLPLLGARPIAGRVYEPGEERERVAVVSERLWERSYGRDPSLVGSTIRLDGEPYTVVGVVPADFKYPERRVEVYVPLAADSAESRRDARGFLLLGRLRAGRTPEDLQPEVAAIAERLAGTYSENAGLGAVVETVKDNMYGPEFERATAILMLAVLFVLLIACANIANLMLARAAGRQREIAVRAALGAGRRRLTRQLLTESVVLAFAGGALGLLLSIWGIDLLVSAIPADVPRVDEIGLDARALGFTAFLCVASGIAFGLAPAVQATRPDLTESLKEGGARGATAGRARSRLRSALVVAQVALALVLLVATGLLVKGYRGMIGKDPGFAREGVVTMWVDLPVLKYPEDAQVFRFQDALLQGIRALPRVEAASLTSGLPLYGADARPFDLVGAPPDPSGRKATLFVKTVTPGFFETFDVPLIEGRLLEERDNEDGRPVLLVNQAFGRRFLADASPVGRVVRFEDGEWEIVGVVGDTYEWGTDEEPPVMGYLPYRQNASHGMYVAVATREDSTAVVSAIRTHVARLDPDQPVAWVRTVEGVIADATSGERIMANLLTIFSLIALVLAAVGVYGVMAYGVSQRTHEFGIRMALGAEARDVKRMVLRQGLGIGGIGIAIGLALAAGATRFLGYFLLGVDPLDPATFAGVTAALLGAVALASWVPARRATRVDPMVALRYE